MIYATRSITRGNSAYEYREGFTGTMHCFINTYNDSHRIPGCMHIKIRFIFRKYLIIIYLCVTNLILVGLIVIIKIYYVSKSGFKEFISFIPAVAIKSGKDHA